MNDEKAFKIHGEAMILDRDTFRAMQMERCGPQDHLSINIAKLVQAESGLITRITNNDPKDLVFIGAGAACDSAIFFSRFMERANITGLELRHDAAALANRIFRRYATPPGRIIAADGLVADYSRFDVVVIANYTHPKAQIVKQVLATRKPGALMAVRHSLNDELPEILTAELSSLQRIGSCSEASLDIETVLYL